VTAVMPTVTIEEYLAHIDVKLEIIDEVTSSGSGLNTA